MSGAGGGGFFSKNRPPKQDIQYIPVYKGTEGTWKCDLNEQLIFIYRLKLYTPLIYRKNKTALYRQWFVI